MFDHRGRGLVQNLAQSRHRLQSCRLSMRGLLGTGFVGLGFRVVGLDDLGFRVQS